ncbi:MAG TPA: MFS transporter [Solirubrobacteraceae bacterium]
MSAHELAPRLPWTARALSHQWAALAVVLTGTFMVVLDFFIVNVAMPAMQSDLHAGTGAIEWVIAGYGLTFATFLITAGRLGDQLGRRRMFSLGLALFTLASAICGVAPSPAVLVGARLAQGLAAALLSPQVLSIIGVVYTGPDRVRAISIYGIVLGLAAVGGQLIGGVLVQADIAGLGWRSCFLINVPIGLVALAIAARAVPESRVEGANRLDLVGTALVTLGLVDIVLPLVEGRQHGWPAWTWLCLGAAPITLGLFAAHQRRLSRRGGAPLLDPALFRERAFSAGLVTQLVFFSSMASYFLVLALYLQQGRGLDALQAGLVFTILAAAYLVASAYAPGLTPRLGRRLPALGGLVLAAGHGLLALSVADIGVGGSVALLVPGMLLEGAGMGLVITPLTSTVLGSLQPQNAGAAAGALSTMQQVGNALGVAVTGVIFFGALDGGFGHAFEVSLIQLALLGTAVTALTWLLPRREAA